MTDIDKKDAAMEKFLATFSEALATFLNDSQVSPFDPHQVEHNAAWLAHSTVGTISRCLSSEQPCQCLTLGAAETAVQMLIDEANAEHDDPAERESWGDVIAFPGPVSREVH